MFTLIICAIVGIVIGTVCAAVNYEIKRHLNKGKGRSLQCRS